MRLEHIAAAAAAFVMLGIPAVLGFMEDDWSLWARLQAAVFVPFIVGAAFVGILTARSKLKGSSRD